MKYYQFINTLMKNTQTVGQTTDNQSEVTKAMRESRYKMVREDETITTFTSRNGSAIRISDCSNDPNNQTVVIQKVTKGKITGENYIEVIQLTTADFKFLQELMK